MKDLFMRRVTNRLERENNKRCVQLGVEMCGWNCSMLQTHNQIQEQFPQINKSG